MHVYKDLTGLDGSKSQVRESHQKAVLVVQEKDLLIKKKGIKMPFGVKLTTSKCLASLSQEGTHTVETETNKALRATVLSISPEQSL